MSEIIPSRPIFSSQSKADSSVKKNSKKRKKNGKVKAGGKKKKNASKKVEKKSNDDQEADEDSDVDLNKELKAIGAYISNRDEMLEHVFKSVKEHKLKTLLPDILKNIPVNELKELCCHQLEGMSKKRIRHILAGEEMNSSSGTEESLSDDGRMAEKEIQQEPQMRDTSPDTSTVVHSTCDSQQGDGEMSVGSTQDLMADSMASTSDARHAADVIELEDSSPIRSEEEEDENEEEKMEETDEENESVTSEDMEEGSEDGELRSVQQNVEGQAGSSTQEHMETLPDKSRIEEDPNVSGNIIDWEEEQGGNEVKEGGENEVKERVGNEVKEGGENEVKERVGNEDRERVENEDRERVENEVRIGQVLSYPKQDNLSCVVKPNEQSEGSKPSSELEILELELRARAIRSLMQKVAQNKESK